MPAEKIPFETLLTDLHGSDWQRRCDAARELGKSRDPRAVDALLPDLDDPNWKVRRNAVQALGALKSPRAVEPLLGALHDRVMTVRQRAAVALGRIKDPAVIPALVQAVVRDSGSDSGQAAYQALRKFGKKALPFAAEALKEKPNYYLVELIGENPLAEHVDLLIGLAQQNDPMIRMRAVEGLGNVNDPRAIEFLIGLLQKEEETLKSNAVQSLGRLGAREAIPALLDLLQKVAIHGVHSGMYPSIAGAFQEMSGVRQKLEQAFPMGRGPAMMMGPGGLSLPEASGMLGNDTFTRINEMLAGLEARIQDVGTHMNLPPELVENLKDRTWQFGSMFQDARDAGKERIKLLLELLISDVPLERAAAALTLPRYGDPQALGPLEEATHDADETVRRAALWAHAALVHQAGMNGA